jgi:hypothetical protein
VREQAKMLRGVYSCPMPRRDKAAAHLGRQRPLVAANAKCLMVWWHGDRPKGRRMWVRVPGSSVNAVWAADKWAQLDLNFLPIFKLSLNC